jgi:hypothetical protein
MSAKRKTSADFRHKTIVVSVMNNACEHLGYYQFELPVALYDGYPQVVSYNAFFNGYKGKRRSQSATRIYTAMRLEERNLLGDFNPDKLPVIKTENIWSFYSHIGWNHKVRRYVCRDRNFE